MHVVRVNVGCYLSKLFYIMQVARTARLYFVLVLGLNVHLAFRALLYLY